MRNPPDDFTATVIANHVRTAKLEAKRAYQYATQFPGVRFVEVAGSVAQHAANAGQYAAYSGQPLEHWHAELAQELTIPAVRAAFDAQFQATAELLATPDEELEENPARRWSSSEVQSLLFSKDNWTVASAKRWAKDNGFRYGNLEETVNYYHLRQFDPNGRPCRTITLATHRHGNVKARVCAA